MKQLKKWDLISAALFLIGAVVFYFGCMETARFDAPLTLAGCGILLLSIILSFLKLRCPFCRHPLGLFFHPQKEFCPYCRCRLKDD